MKYGEIKNLGRHKLMCGDATRREDVYKLIEDLKVNLVLTDPPYGINIFNSGGHFKGKNGGAKYKTRIYQEYLGDKDTSAAEKNYEILHTHEKLIYWGGQYFNFLPASRGWIVWDRKMNIKNYSGCEMAWTSFLGHNYIYSQRWCGFAREGSLKLNPKPKVHPTQKPVELHMQILEDFTKPDDVILDCFGGSGTTLIACEMTGRTCLMMEISPDYCEIIKNRYEKLTSEKIFK